MRHEKTVSESKIKPLWEPWEEDETPRKRILTFEKDLKPICSLFHFGKG